MMHLQNEVTPVKQITREIISLLTFWYVYIRSVYKLFKKLQIV